MNKRSDQLLAHYRVLHRRYGRSHHAVQWSSLDAQRRRFDVLSDLIEPGEHVVDLGCGLGDLLTHLREVRGFEGFYTGADQVESFIEDASKYFAKDTSARFMVCNTETIGQLPPCDCIVMSGLFNNRLDVETDNTEWLTTTVSHAFDHVRRAVGFNVLSSASKLPHESSLYYMDPSWMFDWCTHNLSRRLVLRHCLLYTSPSPRDATLSRMPSSA